MVFHYVDLAQALTSVHFNVFHKRFHMLSQCLVPSITKKVISYLLVLGQQPLITFQIQNFKYVFQYILLRSLETFLIRNYV